MMRQIANPGAYLMRAVANHANEEPHDLQFDPERLGRASGLRGALPVDLADDLSDDLELFASERHRLPVMRTVPHLQQNDPLLALLDLTTANDTDMKSPGLRPSIAAKQFEDPTVPDQQPLVDTHILFVSHNPRVGPTSACAATTLGEFLTLTLLGRRSFSVREDGACAPLGPQPYGR